MIRGRAPVCISVMVVVVLGLMFARSVEAQVTPGIRGGLSLDPDQFYFGGHVETSALVDRLHFKPNVEIGLGDNVTTVALNFEFVYKFPSRQRWQVYAGAGPAVNVFNFGDDFGGGSETDGSFNFLIGAEHRDGLFFELKIGLNNPDLKFGVGWVFR